MHRRSSSKHVFVALAAGRSSLQEHGSASQQGPLPAVWTLESAPYHVPADVTDKTISGWLFVATARQVARAACGALATPVPCGPDGWKTLTTSGSADHCTTSIVRGPEHGGSITRSTRCRASQGTAKHGSAQPGIYTREWSRTAQRGRAK